MKTIDENIKNHTFPTSYLLYGEETYLLKQYKDKLLKALTADGDQMNFSSFEGKEAVPETIIDLAETLPFFAEKRVILVENSKFFKNSCDAIADYLPSVPESTCILFVENEVDKRSRCYKQIKKYGSEVEFSTPGEDVLVRWILQKVRKEGKEITRDAMESFLAHTGNDMGTIDRELEKLFCYTLQKNSIEASDVNAVTTVQTESRIFDMVDAIASGNEKMALELYSDLLALNEPAMRILYLIGRQFRIMYEVQCMTAKREPRNVIAKSVGVFERYIPKYQSQASRFKEERLRQAVEECVDLEERVKTGRMTEKIAVELIIAKYSV